MSRVFDAITAEPWAITPDALQLIARICMRHDIPDASREQPEFVKRDYQLLAGPGAQKLAGAERAFVVDGVGILPVMGPIFPRANMMTQMSGATSVTMLQNDYRVMLQNADIGAIILQMDTPGGAVSGIAAFADMVSAGTKKKKTVAYVSGGMNSAGYWIGSQTSEINLDRTSIVGSIGVVAGVPVQVAPDSDGEMILEIVSTNAPNKRPDVLSDEGRAQIVATLDAIEQQFVGDVARGRKVPVSRVLADFGKGGVKVGSDAVSAGMADKVQSYEATLNAMRREVANQRRLTALKQ